MNLYVNGRKIHFLDINFGLIELWFFSFHFMSIFIIASSHASHFTGHQVWLPVRDGDGRSCHPCSGIMINSRGERRTKALERIEDLKQTPRKIRSEKLEGTDAVDTNFHMRLVEISHVAMEDPLVTGVALWLKLILFIITFDLILIITKW